MSRYGHDSQCRQSAFIHVGTKAAPSGVTRYQHPFRRDSRFEDSAFRARLRLHVDDSGQKADDLQTAIELLAADRRRHCITVPFQNFMGNRMYRYYYFRIGLLLSEGDETRSDLLLRYLFQIAETRSRPCQAQKPVAYLFERSAIDVSIVVKHFEFGILPGDEFFTSCGFTFRSAVRIFSNSSSDR